jgi:hypothetical protein
MSNSKEQSVDQAAQGAPSNCEGATAIADSARQDLTRKINVCIEKGDRAAKKAEELDAAAALHTKKAEEFYIAAGQYIKDVKGLWEDHWLEIIEHDCKIGRSRAYEILAIADGRTTLEKVRSGNTQRQKISRERRKTESVTTAMSRTEPEPKPGSVEYERDRAEVIALYQKVLASEQELAEHKAGCSLCGGSGLASAQPKTCGTGEAIGQPITLPCPCIKGEAADDAAISGEQQDAVNAKLFGEAEPKTKIETGADTGEAFRRSWNEAPPSARREFLRELRERGEICLTDEAIAAAAEKAWTPPNTEPELPVEDQDDEVEGTVEEAEAELKRLKDLKAKLKDNDEAQDKFDARRFSPRSRPPAASCCRE